ncbi:periodic tryptophan protein 1 homolog [Diachasma alloeum]|uniref:periodic tryptophan protein 1 homolog n=1 Tax=Diachasma alloeum TaxID=454923 RepID=UPI0007384352|nr:periodic tryptophan protein 1 homolog [Diachasma alloeum]
MNVNVIPCTTWVKRGVAAPNPEKVQLTPAELEGIIKNTQTELEDVDSDSEVNDQNDHSTSNGNQSRNSAPSGSTAASTDEFNFENYDDEDGNIQCNIGGLAVINADGKDPFVTVGDDEDEDSEKEDDVIKPDDNLVLVAHVEGDASLLEIFVYNEKEGSFYCHHDLLLPAFPLCMEWLNFDPSDAKPANFCAIGDMTPIIQVWDLDLIDCLEPAFTLGSKPKKKKKQKRVGHKDAVLDLAWNSNYTHVLASGSVDQTVLLWDLENGTPVTKIKHFAEKVQSIAFHPHETHHLLTGCADSTARLFDCRVDDTFKSWETTGEVERVLWNHFDPNYFFISTNNGNIECIDVRQGQHVWQKKAHEKEITGLSLSSSCPGLLVTSCDDSVIKVWDVLDIHKMDLIFEKKTNLGALQCLASCPDSPFVFTSGGDNKSHNYKVWDLMEITAVSERFKGRQLRFPDNAVSPSSDNHQGELMEVTEDMECITLKDKKKCK